MYYDEEQNNKNPDIGENPSSPQEPEANPAEASAVSPQEAPAPTLRSKKARQKAFPKQTLRPIHIRG